MTSLATLADQARHYAAVRARLWGAPRRQWVKREWYIPTVVEAFQPSDKLDCAVRSVLALGRATTLQIVDIVSFCFAVPQAEVLGRSRSPRYTTPRHLAMTLAHRQLRGRTSGSLGAIGRVFGRDHTTVLHAIRKFGPLIEQVISALPPPAQPRSPE